MIVDWLKTRTKFTPNKRAVVDTVYGKEYSYSELNTRAEQLAAYLLREGIKEGDHVAVLAENDISHFDFLFATIKIGAVFIPLNWRLKQNELTKVLKDSKPKIIAHLTKFEKNLEDYTEDHQKLKVDQDEYTQIFQSAYDEIQLPSPITDEEKIAVLIYTSGSTGDPKGAMISHRAMISNALYTIPSWNLTEDDRTITIPPMFHTAGLFSLVVPILMVGGEVIIQSKFDGKSSFEMIRKYRPTKVFMIPTMYYDVLLQEDSDISELDSVELFVSGGAPMSEKVYRAFEDAELPLIDSYGLTEVGPNNFYISPGNFHKKRGTVGKPIMFSEVRIINTEGQPVEVGETGELLISGNHAFSGYLDNPEETQKSFEGRFVRTGDLAKFDTDGDFYIVGRKKEMIISGGENIYPTEVENVLDKHPAVNESVVVGYPNEKWGETVVAAVVLNGEILDAELEEALDEYSSERLAVYKKPKEYMEFSEFPRNSVGKIDKIKIIELFIEDLKINKPHKYMKENLTYHK